MEPANGDAPNNSAADNQRMVGSSADMAKDTAAGSGAELSQHSKHWKGMRHASAVMLDNTLPDHLSRRHSAARLARRAEHLLEEVRTANTLAACIC